jgi:hypothetical protein
MKILNPSDTEGAKIGIFILRGESQFFYRGKTKLVYFAEGKSLFTLKITI